MIFRFFAETICPSFNRYVTNHLVDWFQVFLILSLVFLVGVLYGFVQDDILRFVSEFSANGTLVINNQVRS